MCSVPIVSRVQQRLSIRDLATLLIDQSRVWSEIPIWKQPRKWHQQGPRQTAQLRSGHGDIV